MSIRQWIGRWALLWFNYDIYPPEKASPSMGPDEFLLTTNRGETIMVKDPRGLLRQEFEKTNE